MTELRSTTRAGDHSGRFAGKMIVVQNTSDDYAWPHAGHMYGRLVGAVLGDSVDKQLRLWFNDHAAHLPAPPTSTRLVNYRGSVEAGGTRRRRVGRARDGAPGDHRLRVGPRMELAHARPDRVGAPRYPARGHARGERWRARRGARRRHRDLRCRGRGPAGAGTLVRAEWDFDGSGAWPIVDDASTAPTRVCPSPGRMCTTPPARTFPPSA